MEPNPVKKSEGKPRRKGFPGLLDQISWFFLILIGTFMAIAPFPATPQPHLVEKIGMLAAGTLSRPIDIFDLFWHSLPLIMMALKAYYTFVRPPE
jgi:hypothetical protein